MRCTELLLEANLGNTTFYLPTFSVRPENGHPVVAYHIPVLALLEEEVDLAFVLTEQLLPLLDEWKTWLRDALDTAPSGADPLPFPGTFGLKNKKTCDGSDKHWDTPPMDISSTAPEDGQTTSRPAAIAHSFLQAGLRAGEGQGRSEIEERCASISCAPG